MRDPALLLAIPLLGVLAGCDAYFSNKVSVSLTSPPPYAALQSEGEVVSVIKSTLRELGMQPSPGDPEGHSWYLHEGEVHVDIEVTRGIVVAKIEQVRGGFGYGPTSSYRETRDTLKQRLQEHFGESNVTLR